MTRPRLLIDVTQYVCWPATSGVQRVLLQLASCWTGKEVDAQFGFIDKSRYVTGPIRAFGDLVRAGFETSDALIAAKARHKLRREATGSVGVRQVNDVFDAYFLPEPTLQRASLAVAERLRCSERLQSFFIYYDAIPLTNPEFFAKGTDSDGAVTRYHQVLAEMDNVAFISTATRQVFEHRIVRRRLERAVVARLGADGLPHVAGGRPEPPAFTVLGTVEPRKRHQVVLEAFEHLWESGREYRLVVLGPPGSGQPALLERLGELSTTSRLDWIQEPSDGMVASTIAQSTAVVFTPSVEGSGLPALEALALGCPVIVSADLPALEGLDGAGQIRLEQADGLSIAKAVETLADPAANDEYRAAIRELALPTWAAFVAEVETWIAESLSARGMGSSSAATENPR